MMSNTVQLIEKNGRPEWAIIPYKEYMLLAEFVSLAQEANHFEESLESGKEELLPVEYADRLINGENPIYVWRIYRKMTQAKLAKHAEISIPYLSQLENNERSGSKVVLKKIANALKISMDDIV